MRYQKTTHGPRICTVIRFTRGSATCVVIAYLLQWTLYAFPNLGAKGVLNKFQGGFPDKAARKLKNYNFSQKKTLTNF